MKVKARGDATQEVLEWLQQVGVIIPDAQPVCFGWTGNGYDEKPVNQATDDDLVITPDTPTVSDLASVVVSIVHECGQTFPGRRNWRRWKITGWLASKLYTSGLCSSGGGLCHDGRDPIGGWVQTMPAWDLHHRPYVLFKQDWWWQCHRDQGWRLRGRHRPVTPWIGGICARCLPCPSCGEPYDCQPDCETAL